MNEPIRRTYEAEMKEVFSLSAADSPNHEGNLRFLFCVSVPDTLPAFSKPVTGGLGNALYFCLMRIEKQEGKGAATLKSIILGHLILYQKAVKRG